MLLLVCLCIGPAQSCRTNGRDVFPTKCEERGFATFSCLLCKKPKSIQVFRQCRISRGCQYLFGSNKASCFQNKWIAATRRLPQPAALKRTGCIGWQCCNEGLPQRGDFCSWQCRGEGGAAAGRCRGGRVSAMGRILRRSREALLRQRCRTKGGITVRLSDPAPPPRPVCTRMAPIGSI